MFDIMCKRVSSKNSTTYLLGLGGGKMQQQHAIGEGTDGHHVIDHLNCA